jgi:FKBP-type peptidyl-prolyl cis-trans isomerase (trigger factor)
MVCTWRPLVKKISILLPQARVGREIERYVREREEEMRKQQGG